MNWTGGRRACHDRFSSDNTRRQKQYFAKIRSSLNTIPATPTSSASSVFGAAGDVARRARLFAGSRSGDVGADVEPTTLGGKRRKVFPEFDIVLGKTKRGNEDRRGKDTNLKSLGKRLLSTGEDEEIPLLERTQSRRRLSAPSNFLVEASRKNTGSKYFKTKKQLLLESEDWVCTTLSGPLVSSRAARDQRNTIGAFVKPPSFDQNDNEWQLPPLTNPPETEYCDGDDDDDATETLFTEGYDLRDLEYAEQNGEGIGVFKQLSQGGYVRIGNKNIARKTDSSAFPHRENVKFPIGSDISQDSMLLDYEERNQGPNRYPTPIRLGNQLQPLPNHQSREENNGYRGFCNAEQRCLSMNNFDNPHVHFNHDQYSSVWINHDLAPEHRSSSPSLDQDMQEQEEDLVQRTGPSSHNPPSSPSTVFSTIRLKQTQPIPTVPVCSLKNITNALDKEYAITSSHSYSHEEYSKEEDEWSEKNTNDGNEDIEIQPSLVAYASSSQGPASVNHLGNSNLQEPGEILLDKGSEEPWERFLGSYSVVDEADQETGGSIGRKRSSSFQENAEGIGFHTRKELDDNMRARADKDDGEEEEEEGGTNINLQSSKLPDPHMHTEPGSEYSLDTRPCNKKNEDVAAPWREFVGDTTLNLIPPAKDGATTNRTHDYEQFHHEDPKTAGSPEEADEKEDISSNPTTATTTNPEPPLLLTFTKADNAAWRAFVFGDDDPSSPSSSENELPISKGKPNPSSSGKRFTAPTQKSSSPLPPPAPTPQTTPSSVIAAAGTTPPTSSIITTVTAHKSMALSSSSSPSSLSPPIPDPVALAAYTRPKRYEKKDWRGGKRLLTWVGKGKRVRGRKGKGKEREEEKEEEEDDIEDW